MSWIGKLIKGISKAIGKTAYIWLREKTRAKRLRMKYRKHKDGWFTNDSFK